MVGYTGRFSSGTFVGPQVPEAQFEERRSGLLFPYSHLFSTLIKSSNWIWSQQRGRYARVCNLSLLCNCFVNISVIQPKLCSKLKVFNHILFPARQISFLTSFLAYFPSYNIQGWGTAAKIVLQVTVLAIYFWYLS